MKQKRRLVQARFRRGAGLARCAISSGRDGAVDIECVVSLVEDRLVDNSCTYGHRYTLTCSEESSCESVHQQCRSISQLQV